MIQTESMKKLIEKTLNLKCKVSETDNTVVFSTKDAILSFMKDKNVFLFNPNINLYPHESCKIMVDLMIMLKKQKQENFAVGSSFLYKNGNILFGDEAKKIGEENFEIFFEDEVDRRKEMDYILEDDFGFEC